MAEWSIALVLKTSDGQPFVSSNLTASASKRNKPSRGAAIGSAGRVMPRGDRQCVWLAASRHGENGTRWQVRVEP